MMATAKPTAEIVTSAVMASTAEIVTSAVMTAPVSTRMVVVMMMVVVLVVVPGAILARHLKVSVRSCGAVC